MKAPMKMSAMYNYVRGRQLEGTYPGDQKTGMWVSTGMRIGKGWGCPTAEDWPYDGTHWPPLEPPDMDIKAKAKRVLAYERARSIDDCRTLLFAKFPILAAFQIDDSWPNAKKGVIPVPRRQPISGSHAITIMGYNDKTRLFHFANTWGTRWGDDGYGYLPYDYFRDRLLEAWIQLMPEPKGIPKVGSSGIECRMWGLHEPLGGVLHGIEFVDLAVDELIGWGFAIEREAFLDIEELFVRPKWRKQGKGSHLTNEFIDLSTRLKRPLRVWIPHSDYNNNPALKAVSRHLGLSLESSPVRWAAAVGR